MTEDPEKKDGWEAAGAILAVALLFIFSLPVLIIVAKGWWALTTDLIAGRV